jgi:hypothetical protein
MTWGGQNPAQHCSTTQGWRVTTPEALSGYSSVGWRGLEGSRPGDSWEAVGIRGRWRYGDLLGGEERKNRILGNHSFHLSIKLVTITMK